MRQQTKTPVEKAGPDAAWAHEVLLWPFTAARLALDAYAWWLDDGSRSSDRQGETSLPWTTANTIALQLPSMQLRDFSRRGIGRPVLVCAPYSLHGALIADFASGHSVVEALQQGGLDRVYLTDWRSAEPDMRYFSIDSYLADLNIAVDEIGPPVDLVGLCQGGWLSLVYAARFAEKVRRLVLVGTPVDVSVQSELSRAVANVPKPALDELIRRAGGIVSGEHMHRLWSSSFSLQDVEAALQRNLTDETAESRALLDRFERWDGKTLDLPGTYYLEVTDWIFRENRIAQGRFIALGRKINLAEVRVPLFLLAGADDAVVPLDQAFATARLLGTPPACVERGSEPCGHLGLMMGCKTLSNSWPRIARWLETDQPEFRSQPCHNGLADPHH
ncbi:alpha/beta fold hydrolase [Bradyrhizobium sp. KBS0727]|uniref:alpha/beta fold hydrolase n=1 Tax=unclassified Bradyrhizobium TaxID=2631580 RepID=UPI00110E2094|nr:MULTISPECIES: alpha/beta fold hydrolase [unclassified Bradyrhizobium]QDW40799.1 alpha/beta fold hydrolase [Bradyrhizobium sp. KBS0725]QDW47405.1 alpha/beta fold hydrolase [Bradyrhizobium sp. KBS0727]